MRFHAERICHTQSRAGLCQVENELLAASIINVKVAPAGQQVPRWFYFVRENPHHHIVGVRASSAGIASDDDFALGDTVSVIRAPPIASTQLADAEEPMFDGLKVKLSPICQ